MTIGVIYVITGTSTLGRGHAGGPKFGFQHPMWSIAINWRPCEMTAHTLILASIHGVDSAHEPPTPIHSRSANVLFVLFCVSFRGPERKPTWSPAILMCKILKNWMPRGTWLFHSSHTEHSKYTQFTRWRMQQYLPGHTQPTTNPLVWSTSLTTCSTPNQG